MSKVTDYIIILCGVFGDSYTPLTRSGFWKLYHKCGDSVEAMIDSGDEKVEELLKRSGSISFSKEKLDQMGIRMVSFLDDDYPKVIYDKLKDFAPPLLYMCGDASVKDGKFAGYVGSRSIGEEDILWTEKMVHKNLRSGFSIVTGGAKGIDSVAMNYALENDGKVVVFLPDNITTKINEPYYRNHIMNGNLLVYSHLSPFEKKGRNTFVAAAMERNKFIYAQAAATAVVKSDLQKGGTWSGAVECMKHNWGRVFAWDNKAYPGNQELIRLGARSLDDKGEHVDSEADIKAVAVAKLAEDKNEYVQMSLMDMLNNN